MLEKKGILGGKKNKSSVFDRQGAHNQNRTVINLRTETGKKNFFFFVFPSCKHLKTFGKMGREEKKIDKENKAFFFPVNNLKTDFFLQCLASFRSFDVEN